MKKPFRIAIGGIRHETNTFSPFPTEYEHFQIHRGAALLSEVEAGLGAGQAVEYLPTFVAGALPGGLVRRTAYERLKQ
jgi:microcystin degradation protein MlrC